MNNEKSLYQSPYRATWYMTNRCNLACPHCFVPIIPEAANANELSFSQGKAMLDDLIESHVYMICFAGGEPLVHKDFLPLAAYAREIGMTIQVATNGLMLQKVGVQSLIEAGFKCIQISLDGATKSSHEKIRGPHTFEQTLSAIRSCVDAKLPVILAVAITKINHRQLRAIFEFAKNEKVWGVKLQPVLTSFNLDGENENLAINSGEMIKSLEEVKPLFAANNIHLTIMNEHLLSGQCLPCNQDLSYAVIFPDGSVGTCDSNPLSASGGVIKQGFKNSWELAIANWSQDKACCGAI